MASPCPRCGIELFDRKLPRKSVGHSPGQARRTSCCPSCQVPLQNDPRARGLAAVASAIGLFAIYGLDGLNTLLGDGWGAIVRTGVLASASLVLVYSIMAFPYV